MNSRTLQVGDLVANVGDRSVVGEVVATSTATGGLHASTALDTWGTTDGPRFADSGKVPVRWNTDVPYEWWEEPEFIEVVRSAPDFARGPEAANRTA